jgi:hypothetical protein
MPVKLSIANLPAGFATEEVEEVFGQFKGFKGAIVFLDPRTRTSLH